MNCKKVLISSVATMLLITSVFADSNAIYVPMSNTSKDGLWTFIGVNGLSTGQKSTYGTSSGAYSTNFVREEDTNTTDYEATLSTNKLVSLLALKDSGLSALEMGILYGAVSYVAEESIRSMYIKVNSPTPNVKINYKSSLEGVKVEFYINGDMDTRYESTISQNSTYSDAVTATLYDGGANDASVLNKIVDVLDFNSTDNPVDAKYYAKSTDLDTNGESAVFYHFDAKSQQWKIWDKSLSGSANDFTEFKIGDAYWGQVDRVDNFASITSDDDGATTLILGKSGNNTPTADIYRDDDSIDYDAVDNSRLTTGWNMIALDAVKPYIRHAATGLVVGTNDVNGTIVLTDSTGVHSLGIDLFALTAGYEKAIAINLAFEKAKAAGEIPSYFNVKAFGTTAVTDIILISDARFTIEDDRTTPADLITTVKTLNDQFPYNNRAGNLIDITNLDHNTSDDSLGSMESATSAYGEYALILNTLVSNSSNTLDGTTEFSKIQFGDATNGDHTSIKMTGGGASTIAGVVSAIPTLDTEFVTTPVVNAIDTNNDGTVDMVIVANDKPFYVKDKTYTRVFSVDASSVNGTSDKFTVLGASQETIIPATSAAGVASATDVAAKMNTIGATTKVYAGVSSSNNLVAVSVGKSNFDLKDIESQTLDLLTNSSDSSDLAKGAIGSVHALDEIAKISLVPHIWTASGFSLNPANVDAANDTIFVEIVSTVDGDGTLGTPINPDDINGTGVSLLGGQDTNVTARLAWFDAIVNDMTVQLSDSSLHGYAYHTYTTDADNLNTADVVLVSYDANLTFTTVGAEMQMPTTTFADSVDALTLGGSGVIGGKLTNDLTTNPVHTPDFASYGPLYAMYDAGYDVRAILKSETDLSTGGIIWDSIDLTRDEDDWFLNNEMNLFKANIYSGYWVYLTAYTDSNIEIAIPTYSSIYTYYFDKDKTQPEQDTTTNIVNGGSLSVKVTKINPVTSSVFVSIDGEEYEMKRSGTSDDYTADLTSYAIKDLRQKDTGPTAVTIRVTNGKGEYKKDTSFEFDYMPPTINAATFDSLSEVEFNTDEVNTTFHIFENYIPELTTTRADDDLTTLIASSSTTTGSSSINICKELTFGDISEIVAITADGDGTIGEVNLSNAETFTYAVMLKGSQVLEHEYNDGNESTYGKRYDDNCSLLAASVPVTDDASGVSLKSLEDNNITAYLSYAEDLTLDSNLSNAYTQEWKLPTGSTKIIEVQNLDEYKTKIFFVEYNSTIYTGVFASVDGGGAGTLTLIEPSNSTLH